VVVVLSHENPLPTTSNRPRASKIAPSAPSDARLQVRHVAKSLEGLAIRRRQSPSESQMSRNEQSDYNYAHPGEASVAFTPAEGVTDAGKRRLLIDPMENVLIGSILIRKYLGISSVTTMYMWHEKYALPITKRPDGQWMTTMSAIDEWIFMGSELDRKQRAFPRGTNRTAEEEFRRAKDRLAKKVAEYAKE
jgi:hypothetical protein